MTVKSKKRRLKRAHAHQALSKGKRQFHNAFSNSMPMTDSLKNFTPTHAVVAGHTIELKSPRTREETAEALTKLQAEVNGVPNRAKCPSCGFSQKVTKAGKMGRHDVFVGSDAQQCEGSGLAWNAVGL